MGETSIRRACADYNLRFCDPNGPVYSAAHCREAEANNTPKQYDYLAGVSLVYAGTCNYEEAAEACRGDD